MKLKAIIKSLFENSTSTYSYGCVMLYFHFPEIKHVHNLIDEEDLYEEEGDKTYGIEDEPHTTLLYGLHEEVTEEQVEDLIGKFHFGDCWIYNPSFFRNKEYDVLKYMVEGDNLHVANRKLRQLPHTTSFPIYNPHLTVAYLKRGCANMYMHELNRRGWNEYKLTPTHVVYSQPDGTKTIINIKT